MQPSAVEERGAALIIALLIAALLTAVAAALIVVTTTETLITGGYRAAQEVRYAAEAFVERSIRELAGMADWTPVITPAPATFVAPFSDTALTPLAPDGRILNLSGLTAARQAASDLVYGAAVFGADSPAWRLYAHAQLQNLVPPGMLTPPAYVLVWVADDGGDGDGDPGQDSNGRLWMHAEAYGVGGARRAVETAIARAENAEVRMLAWKEVR
jgi:hypothetical protein